MRAHWPSSKSIKKTFRSFEIFPALWGKKKQVKDVTAAGGLLTAEYKGRNTLVEKLYPCIYNTVFVVSSFHEMQKFDSLL